ncbi:MAG: hypothetical protein R2771_04550 [Saprospiraceae bacterium]
MGKGKNKISDEVTEKIKKYVSNIKKKIDDNFIKLDSFLENEAKEIEIISDKQNEIGNHFEQIKNELKSKY